MPPHNPAGKWIRIFVYIMLFTSAAATLFLGDSLWDAVRAGIFPMWAPMLAPIAFTAFVITYSIDRAILVYRRRYPLVRAFGQVAFAILFLLQLLPGQARVYREVRATTQQPQQTPIASLLHHPQADVRAAICELIGHRQTGPLAPAVQQLSKQDPAPAVRTACSAAAQKIAATQHHAPPTPQP